MIPFPFRDMEPLRVLAFPKWNDYGDLLGVQWRIYLDGLIDTMEATFIPDKITGSSIWGDWIAYGAKITGVEIGSDKPIGPQKYTIIEAFSQEAERVYA